MVEQLIIASTIDAIDTFSEKKEREIIIFDDIFGAKRTFSRNKA